MRPPQIKQGWLASVGLETSSAWPVTVPSGRVLAVCHVDRIEAERRAAIGLTSVIDRELLEALGDLPHGLPVSWSDVDVLSQVVLDGAPVGCTRTEGHEVTRLLTPVVEPIWFMAELDDVRSIEALSLFAATALRVLVADGSPPVATLKRITSLGIGLALRRGEALTMAVAPDGRFIRPGPRRWFIQERLWEAGRHRMEVQAAR